MLVSKGGEFNIQEAADVLEEDSTSPSLGGQSTLLAIRAKEKHKAVLKLSFFHLIN